jgi:predicted DNA-binding transcriptional regulator AlpA
MATDSHASTCTDARRHPNPRSEPTTDPTIETALAALAEARRCDDWLSTPQAAEEAGITREELIRLRRIGAGPECYRLSPRWCAYRLSDVLAWKACAKR